MSRPSASPPHPGAVLQSSQVWGTTPNWTFALVTVFTPPHAHVQQRVHPQPCLRQREREQGRQQGAVRRAFVSKNSSHPRPEKEIRVFLETYSQSPKEHLLAKGLVWSVCGVRGALGPSG